MGRSMAGVGNLTAALAGSLLLGAVSANAMVAPFGGAATGTDPLGNTYVASNSVAPSWGEPGLGFGELSFNTAGYTSPDDNPNATAFSFTFLAGVGGVITDPSTVCSGFATATRFCDQTTGVAFVPTIERLGTEVVFNAPAGDQINEGDEFFVNVVFSGSVDTSLFSFAGLWTDAGIPVPEPASAALLGVGILGLGLGLARRRKA